MQGTRPPDVVQGCVGAGIALIGPPNGGEDIGAWEQGSAAAVQEMGVHSSRRLPIAEAASKLQYDWLGRLLKQSRHYRRRLHVEKKRISLLGHNLAVTTEQRLQGKHVWQILRRRQLR